MSNTNRVKVITSKFENLNCNDRKSLDFIRPKEKLYRQFSEPVSNKYDKCQTITMSTVNNNDKSVNRNGTISNSKSKNNNIFKVTDDSDKNVKFDRFLSESKLKSERNCVFNVSLSENDSSRTDSRNDSSTTDIDMSNESNSEKPKKFDYNIMKEIKKSDSESQLHTLNRQTSDPIKKLHRSHAFRGDRNQLIGFKRHKSCYARTENGESTLRTGDTVTKLNLLDYRDKKLEINKITNDISNNVSVKSKLAIIEDRISIKSEAEDPEIKLNPISVINSDNTIPKHILEQYAKVNKRKDSSDKNDGLIDSGISSESEFQECDAKKGRLKELMAQFEPKFTPKNKILTNLSTLNDDICGSNDTIKLEMKNPHIKLTETLKKALKQPLPKGPPPKKPPRIHKIEKCKKDSREMLEKLELALKQHENDRVIIPRGTSNIYDVAEKDESLSGTHYMCTELFKIQERNVSESNIAVTLTNCFNSLNCTVAGSRTSTIAYSKIENDVPAEVKNRFSTFFNVTSQFYDESEPIYSEPVVGVDMCQDGVDTGQYGVPRKIDFEDSRQDDVETSHYGVTRTLKPDIRQDGVDKCEYGVTRGLTHDTRQDFVSTGRVVDMLKMFEGNASSSLKLRSRRGKLSGRLKYRSLDDLSCSKLEADTRVYDIPYDGSRSNSPVIRCEPRPKISPKPKQLLEASLSSAVIDNSTKSLEYISTKEEIRKIDFFNGIAENIKFATDCGVSRRRRAHRYQRNKSSADRQEYSANINQITIDRHNLNKLLNELSDSLTMNEMTADTKVQAFHVTESTSDESVKLTRSLTEKRKNYVRRVSSRAAYLERDRADRQLRHQTSLHDRQPTDQVFNTFRSWRSFKQHSVDSGDPTELSGVVKSDCVADLTGGGDRIFEVCLLVGLDYSNGRAYVKRAFPKPLSTSERIESLVFPETVQASDAHLTRATACNTYSMVMTDERGVRTFAYCRRVLPEGATDCLPLAYCLVTNYRAPGFYYKLLKEIESLHGSSDDTLECALNQLSRCRFPEPGQSVRMPARPTLAETRGISNETDMSADDSCQLRHGSGSKAERAVLRPIEPRLDEHCLSLVLDTLGPSLLVKVFGSLLLERKVVIICDKLSVLSSCVDSLQLILQPFLWQHTIISTVPRDICREIMEAPLPILAGIYKHDDIALESVAFEEGIAIDISQPTPKVIHSESDESSIIPSNYAKLLKHTLQTEYSSRLESDTVNTRNVLVSEAFVSFFIELLGDFWSYFKEDDVVEFDVESYKQSSSDKQTQLFLEWFTETAMFQHFVQNMTLLYKNVIEMSTDERRMTEAYERLSSCDRRRAYVGLTDLPYPEFYELMLDRLKLKTESRVDIAKSNYKSVMNRKVQKLKVKLKDLLS